MNNEEVVKLLKEDLKVLMNKRKSLIDSFKIDETIKVTRLIKDTLELIDKYDWKEYSSVYSTQNTHNEQVEIPEMIDVISIWKQNSIGECKEHKMWERGNKIL